MKNIIGVLCCVLSLVILNGCGENKGDKYLNYSRMSTSKNTSYSSWASEKILSYIPEESSTYQNHILRQGHIEKLLEIEMALIEFSGGLQKNGQDIQNSVINSINVYALAQPKEVERVRIFFYEKNELVAFAAKEIVDILIGFDDEFNSYVLDEIRQEYEIDSDDPAVLQKQLFDGLNLIEAVHLIELIYSRLLMTDHLILLNDHFQ